MELDNLLSSKPNAIDLLKQDHRKVEALFDEYEEAKDKRVKLRIAQTICKELELHAKLEEQIFYPTSKAQAKDARDDVNEGIVEHKGIKMLVKQISAMTTGDELFDSSVTVLKEYVKHHVKEEESEMFPKIESSRVDLEALGERLQKAKQRMASAKAQTRAVRASSATKARSGRKASTVRRKAA
jgi:hemerythrin superfamily protein